MSVNIIPTIFITLVFFLSKVDNGTPSLPAKVTQENKMITKNKQIKNNPVTNPKKHNKTIKEKQVKPISKDKSMPEKGIISPEVPLDYKEDMKAIYGFITNKFKRIAKEDAKRISNYLIEYGKKHKLDPKIAAAVIARESGFRKDAVSVTGAKGLGQIKDFNFKDLNISDPFNIDQNINGTVQYLKEMVKNWNDKSKKDVAAKVSTPKTEEEKIRLALASYYKGFTAVKKTGVDTKTQKYVEDILAYYKEIAEQE